MAASPVCAENDAFGQARNGRFTEDNQLRIERPRNGSAEEEPLHLLFVCDVEFLSLQNSEAFLARGFDQVG